MMNTYVNHMSKAVKPFIFKKNLKRKESSSKEKPVNPNSVVISKDYTLFNTTMSYGIPDMYDEYDDKYDESIKIEETEVKVEKIQEKDELTSENFTKVYNELSSEKFSEETRSVNVELTLGKTKQYELFYRLIELGRWPKDLKHIRITYDATCDHQTIFKQKVVLGDLFSFFLSECFPSKSSRLMLGSSALFNTFNLENFIDKFKSISNVKDEMRFVNLKISFENFYKLIRYCSN